VYSEQRSYKSKDFITLRYYGRETRRFMRTHAWPDDASEVCHTFPAVCLNLHVGECIKSPPEFRVPWNRNVTERDAGRRVYDPPLESDLGGYMLLTFFVMKYEAKLRNPWQIFSGCAEGCLDCGVTGTGLALHPLKLPVHQVITEEGGVFAAWYNDGNGTRNTEFSCVDSLADHWKDIEESNSRTSLIKGLVGAGVAVFFGACVFVVYCKHRRYKVQMEEQVLRSIREGTGQFTVSMGPASTSAQRQVNVITQPQIEEQFPVTSVDGEPQCVVCLSPVYPREKGRQLQCHHSFHADCILSWWLHRPRRQIECPVCRQAQTVFDDPPEIAAAIAESEATAAAAAAAAPAAAAAAAAPVEVWEERARLAASTPASNAQAPFSSAIRASPLAEPPEPPEPPEDALASDDIGGNEAASAVRPSRSGPMFTRLEPSVQPQVIGSEVEAKDLERERSNANGPTRC